MQIISSKPQNIQDIWVQHGYQNGVDAQVCSCLVEN